jgi:hypothetical protein
MLMHIKARPSQALLNKCRHKLLVGSLCEHATTSTSQLAARSHQKIVESGNVREHLPYKYFIKHLKYD